MAAAFRRLVAKGTKLCPAGLAREEPEILLTREYSPRYLLRLFGAAYYLTDPVFDEGLGFFVGYVGLPDAAGRIPRLYPRLFYKDSSLAWRVASHFVHNASEFWIGKGDVRAATTGEDGPMFTAEETTNLPFELQAALDRIRGDKKPRLDEAAVERILREGPADRVLPYADFTAPRRRAQERYQINKGRAVASFSKRNDPSSLRFVRGFEPDFRRGVIEETASNSRFFGGALRKFRILSQNRQIQYLFIASPSLAWVIPPQTLTTDLSTYGVRVDDVIVDDDLCVPAYEYHFADHSTDPPTLHTQIPDGFAGDPHPGDPTRSDASAWIEALPVIQEFRARIVGKRKPI